MKTEASGQYVVFENNEIKRWECYIDQVSAELDNKQYFIVISIELSKAVDHQIPITKLNINANGLQVTHKNIMSTLAENLRTIAL